jgi:hypothetical protein
MKHAYLILAHTEFGILQKLLDSLDDNRNDIFIHFDSKVEVLPHLQVEKAGLQILDNRVDVRWGDYSVLEAELHLFESASLKNSYEYYHLLSGVDMPLKSQDFIHQFFENNRGKEFIGYFKGDINNEISRKVRRYHLFPGNFREDSGLNLIKKVGRSIFLKFQNIIGFQRNSRINFKKGTQWLSITDELVKFILTQRPNIKKTYKNTFCCDEIVVQTICYNSKFKDQIYDLNDEARGCMREIRWENNIIRDWTDDDYEELIKSDKLFARKFNSKNMKIVNKILEYVV